MSLVDDTESMRERALVSVRAAFIAAAADHRVLRIDQFGVTHSEPLTIQQFRSFAESVWSAEGRTEQLMISEVEQLPMAVQNEFTDSAAVARWYTVPDWFDGSNYCGPRLVAYIDVKVEGLRRLVALHEIAHLLVDSETTAHGHGAHWIATHRILIERYLPPIVYSMWDLAFEQESGTAAEKIAADPLWLAHLI